MSLELELWAMNSARISALEAGGGGGGSTSDLCVKVPKFEWNYVYEHVDEVIEIRMEDETGTGWRTEFTVPDDGKIHYALLGSDIGFGIPAAAILIESCGGQILDGDSVTISEIIDDGDGSADIINVFANTIWSNHQTILYDPEREDGGLKTYSIAYNDTAYNNPILLKNGSTYQLVYEKIFDIDVDDPEAEAGLDELREFLASSPYIMIVPGTYEEIPVVVRNGGNT